MALNRHDVMDLVGRALVHWRRPSFLGATMCVVGFLGLLRTPGVFE